MLICGGVSARMWGVSAGMWGWECGGVCLVHERPKVRG